MNGATTGARHSSPSNWLLLTASRGLPVGGILGRRAESRLERSDLGVVCRTP